MTDPKPDAGKKPDETNDKTEKTLEDTFPASDPPASTGTTGPTGDHKPRS